MKGIQELCRERDTKGNALSIQNHDRKSAFGQSSRAHILQAGAVLVFVEVVVLPEAQQVVEVVEQAAGVFLCIFLLSQSTQVERQLAPPPCQHQNHQTGV